MTYEIQIPFPPLLILTISAFTPVDDTGSATPFKTDQPPTSDASLVEPFLPSQEAKKNDAQMTQSPTSPGMEFLIKKAKEDLAQRLSVEVTEINLIEAREVVWPDASLGCPKPGMMYAQMNTPGFRIILEAAREWYEYNKNNDKIVVLCEKDNASAIVPRSTALITREEMVMTPVSGNLVNIIDIAKVDLVRRLEMISDEIEVTRIEKAE